MSSLSSRFKSKSIFFLIWLSFFMISQNTQAQEIKVEYPDGIAVDKDLDGLTDEGEKQIFKTDPNAADSDGDGYLDGAEVISQSDPLNAASPSSVQTITNTIQPEKNEIPWAWYITRAGGLVGFLLLYISIFLGLAIRMPILKKIIKPVYSYSIHCWLSLQALFFILIHGLSLLFDKYYNFSLIDIFVPFAFSSDTLSPGLVTLGIVSFYLMFFLVATSYGRRFLSQRVWRVIHSLNIILYIIVFTHALFLGTDMKILLVRSLFIGANILLVTLFFINIASRFSASEKSPTDSITTNN